MSEKTSLIIGAGVMGISAALAAKRYHLEDIVYLINYKQAAIKPASEDTAKIIRDAYSDDMYAKLAAEAIDLWQAEPAYREYWHQSGWIVLHLTGDIYSIPASPQLMSKERFLEIAPGARLENINSISEDPKPAWVEASAALAATVELARSAGVIVKHGRMTDLIWNDKVCVGAVLADGTEVIATSVLLAMGYETASFLQERNLSCEEGQPVFVLVLGVQLNHQQYEKYRDMRILVVPGLGEIMPPDPNMVIKINSSRSFRVPDLSKVTNLPFTLESPYFKENWDLLTWLLPELRGAPIAFYRYCPDWVTKSQDFHIHPVKRIKGLYVAYGGSFHGWKFLPNIG